MTDDAIPGPYADDEVREVRRPGLVVDLATRRQRVAAVDTARLSPAAMRLIHSAIGRLCEELHDTAGATTVGLISPDYRDGVATIDLVIHVNVADINAVAEE